MIWERTRVMVVADDVDTARYTFPSTWPSVDTSDDRTNQRCYPTNQDQFLVRYSW